MEIPLEQQKPSAAAAQQHADELIKLLRKLRWMGLDAEAERMEAALRGASPADSVLAAPHDTD
jgi:hypothetical protein